MPPLPIDLPLQRGAQAEFVPSQWPGHNSSGFTPFGNNVLLKMDECSPITSGGVHIPQDRIEAQNARSETGCIFAIGAGAFRRYDDGSPWEGDRPKIGDRVFVHPYSGSQCKGRDGGVYRLMGEGCILGGLDKGKGKK